MTLINKDINETSNEAPCNAGEGAVSPEKPLSETAILRLKTQSPEDSVLKDMSNSEVLYLSYKAAYNANAAAEMLRDKRKSQSRRLQTFSLITMSVLAVAAVVAAIVFLGLFLYDQTNDVTARDSKIYGTWYTETGASYTFNKDNTMVRTSSAGNTESGTYELNNSHTLILNIYDDIYSYQLDFEDDGTMTWTHYYNGLPDIIYLTDTPQQN